MGLAEIQAALARLYVDPTLRARFFAAPLAVGEELGLNESEARDLARLPERQVERYADSLRRKRVDQARRLLPLSARALGGRFDALFARHVAEAPPRGSKADLDDALAFASTLGRWARDEGIDLPWVADLARYELAWRQASHVGRVPLLRTFRYAVSQLARALAQGEDLGTVAPRASIAIWWRPARRAALRHLVVSLPKASRSKVERP